MPVSGPSAAQSSDEAQGQDFSKLLQQSYQTNFGAQQGILGNLTSVLSPIAEAGPNQEGFSGAEKSALNASAINTNAANYKSAATVVAGGEAGAGGNTYAPTGGQQQVAATIASNAAQNLSGTENQITQADYAQGRQNFGNAVSGLEGVAGQYNPNATGGLALQGNENAFNQANQINQESNAWVGDVAGLVGGLGGAAIGAFCPAAGSMILLMDGSERRIELLKPGDQVQGIDGAPCTIEVIPSDLCETVRVTLENGLITHNSLTHAFALPLGGFTVSIKSKGVLVKTAAGDSKVVSVEDGGVRQVYNIITDGSHTYCADSVWALGVGEAEREIPMDTWARVGQVLGRKVVENETNRKYR